MGFGDKTGGKHFRRFERPEVIAINNNLLLFQPPSPLPTVPPARPNNGLGPCGHIDRCLVGIPLYPPIWVSYLGIERFTRAIDVSSCCTDNRLVVESPPMCSNDSEQVYHLNVGLKTDGG